MIITSKLKMDLTQHTAIPMIHAAQDDRYSRYLELSLFSAGTPWPVPEDASVRIRYSKSDGKGGEYDTLPDGSCAWSKAENVLTIALAPQVLTVPGPVRLSVVLLQGQRRLSTFTILVRVATAVNSHMGESEDYFPGQRIPTEPDSDDIPRVFFGGALPQTKDDAVMTFRYISKTRDISGYCKTKAQGSSSMSYPKKNQTVKLYKDADCTEKLNVDFRGWGPQNKFCFKANWIDMTHARNIVTARLWGDVVKSRQNYGDIPELLRTSPNQGAVDGFPVKVYAGGVYQGRYTLNIPKDAWMANMDDELDTHCILCGENYVSGCFRAEANIDESDWTDEIHDAVPVSIKTRWNEAIRFVMNSTDEEFVSGISSYFDVDSLIDYYLFGLASCGLDAFGKNQLYMTYDGQKWFATMYDMDSTWGLWWDGSSFVATDYARSDYQDFKDGNGNLLYIRLETLFTDRIKIRWEELRSNVLSFETIMNRFEQYAEIAPPYLVEEDYAETTANGAFTVIPSKTTNNIQQIRQFVKERLTYCDNTVMTLGETETYTTLSYIESDGASYIDTGISGGTNAAYEIAWQFGDTQNGDWDNLFAGNNQTIPRLYYVTWDGIHVAASSNDFATAMNTTDKTPYYIRYNTDGTLDTNYGGGEWVHRPDIFTDCAGMGWGDLTWYVFNCHSEPNFMIAMRLYYLKMYTDGVLVRDFIPVMRDSDGKVGLWDKVSSTFFENLGPGTFGGTP